jgi:hypothetical protein
VYDSFRAFRGEFDTRRAMGDELLKAWNKAEQPAEHREAVLAWFRDADRRTKSGEPLETYWGLEEMRSISVNILVPEGAVKSEPAADEETVIPPPLAIDQISPAPKPVPEETIFQRLKNAFLSKSAKEPSPPSPAP